MRWIVALVSAAGLASIGFFRLPGNPLAAPSPVTADCDMVELPDEHDDAYVIFTLTNARPVSATAVSLRLYDQGWMPGDEIGEASVVTLGWRIPSKGTLKHGGYVKGPPHYHNGKFDSLGCTVVHVAFSDGTEWP